MTPTTNAGERPTRMLVFYPGHLGPKPTIETRGRLAEPYDGPGVRDLPAKIGADLVRFSGFFEALPPADAAKRFTLHEVDLAAVTTVQHRASPDAPEVDLVVLDRPTVRRLRTLAALARASAPPAKPIKATTPDSSKES